LCFGRLRGDRQSVLLNFEAVRENPEQLHAKSLIELGHQSVLRQHFVASSCNFAWLYCALMVAIAAFCVIVSLSSRTFRFSASASAALTWKSGVSSLLLHLRVRQFNNYRGWINLDARLKKNLLNAAVSGAGTQRVTPAPGSVARTSRTISPRLTSRSLRSSVRVSALPASSFVRP
jgi:hypothetical protein